MADSSVRAVLTDLLVQNKDIVVLGGYPHPGNDWGWTSWEWDGMGLDDSDWNEPWDAYMLAETGVGATSRSRRDLGRCLL